jgi:hypothetical protein
MSNQLVKDVRISYVPGSPGIPSSPGQPARAAYTAYETQTVCAWETPLPTGGSYQWVFDPTTNQYVYMLVPRNGQAQHVLTPQWVCRTQTVPVYYPAQPYIAPTPGTEPTEEQVVSDFNLGWNSGARSVGFFLGDGLFKFDAPHAITGAIIGLNDEDLGADYLDIEHAFYLAGKTARIYERGVEKHYVGAYADGDTFKFERRGGVVYYYKEDVLVYTSTLPSTGGVFADASLYAGGDAINNPEIRGLNTGGGSPPPPGTVGNEGVVALFLQPLTVSGGDYAYSQGLLTFLPLTLSAGMLSRADLELEPLQLLGGDYADGHTSYGAASLELQPLTVQGFAGRPEPAYALGGGALAPLTLSGYMLSGGMIQADLELEPLTALGSDRPYGEARLSLAPLQLYATAYEGNENASMGSFGFTEQTMTAETFIGIVMDEQGVVTDVMAVQLLIDAASDIDPPGGWGESPDPVPGGGTGGLGGSDGAGADLTVTDSMSAQLVLHALLPTLVEVDAYVPAFGGIVVGTPNPGRVTGEVTGTGTGTGTVVVTGTVTGVGGSTGSGTLTGTLTLPTGQTVTGPITGTVTGTVTGGVFTGVFTGTDSNGNPITGTVAGNITGGTIVGAPSGDGSQVWVVNWDTGASAQYENYAFNSFGRLGGAYYGVMTDGVYVLEGDTDTGAPIRSSMNFGKRDFGTQGFKRMVSAYAGVSSTGDMYLKVTVGDTSYTYVARNTTSGLATQRFDIGKGIKANYVTFELFNGDGSDFELDNIEFTAVELSRRI